MIRPLLPPVLLALACVVAARAGAVTIGGNPGPAHNYVCPHADGGPALDCYFDAVQHLYTMCRDVKAIEIVEFGYDRSTEGTNGAKTEYCLDKQKRNITHPFLAALKQASVSRQAVAALKGLQQMWLSALSNLQWRQGESDAEYKSRVVQPYEEFKDRIAVIRGEYAEIESQRARRAAAAHRKPAPPEHRKLVAQAKAKPR
ncbi:MAG: hypothetical protein ACYDDG_16005 [Casimicrobiaceae bacterium]